MTPPGLPSTGHRAPATAFTLLELLVSCAVLGALVLLLSQVVGMLNQAITSNSKHLDADSQARLVFDRIAADLMARPDRDDLGLLFSKPDGNDSLAFYSETLGYSGTRPMALVGYRIQESNASRMYQMERGASGVDWSTSGTSLVFLPQSMSAPADTDYEVLATGVFRMEMTYVLSSGTATASGSVNYLSNTPPAQSSALRGLVIAIAVIDDKSRALLTNAQIKELSDALGDCDEGAFPITKWNDLLKQSSFGSGLPRKAVQGVHVYQRTFPLP